MAQIRGKRKSTAEQLLVFIVDWSNHCKHPTANVWKGWLLNYVRNWCGNWGSENLSRGPPEYCISRWNENSPVANSVVTPPIWPDWHWKELLMMWWSNMLWKTSCECYLKGKTLKELRQRDRKAWLRLKPLCCVLLQLLRIRRNHHFTATNVGTWWKGINTNQCLQEMLLEFQRWISSGPEWGKHESSKNDLEAGRKGPSMIALVVRNGSFSKGMVLGTASSCQEYGVACLNTSRGCWSVQLFWIFCPFEACTSCSNQGYSPHPQDASLATIPRIRSLVHQLWLQGFSEKDAMLESELKPQRGELISGVTALKIQQWKKKKNTRLQETTAYFSTKMETPSWPSLGIQAFSLADLWNPFPASPIFI